LSFIRHVEQHYTQAIRVLGLGSSAGRVIHALILLDLEGQEKEDPHGRQGIISWRRMVENFAGKDGDTSQMERAIIRLADWGLIQVVGRAPSDPKLTGTSALRLTHAGRVCVGLAPEARLQVRPAENAVPWKVFHHANREGLVVEAFHEVGDLAWRPIVASTDRNQLEFLCGQIAVSLVTRGGAVLDAFGMSANERIRDLPDLIWRTRSARLPRIVMLPDPKPVRLVAAATKAELRWVEPQLDTRREGQGDTDVRVTELLPAHGEGEMIAVADAVGVPKSSLARPKKVDTDWTDLFVPESVRTQIEQALLHAMYRLREFPDRVGRASGYRLLLSGLPGTGKSMAAEALATKLGMSVVKLDLSSVLSKWLGETEQMIGQVFDLAEASNSILVLDEAESLFRQRQSGGSGGSNALQTAVAYLLTRLDRYEGVLVATTNRTQDIDDALFRRFDDYIILPVPDHDTRRSLWLTMLAQFSDQVEVSDHDYERLARYFVISGGLIRGAAIRATGWAAGLGTPVNMPVILAALARELEKSDHPTSNVLMEPYRDSVSALLNDKRYPSGAVSA